MKLSAAGVVLILFSTVHFALANDGYALKNKEEVAIFAAVLRSEGEANGLTKKELTCLEVDGKDPGKKLVSALRRQHLNVRSETEWHKTFACGFTLRLQPVEFDSPEAARVRVATIDNREINAGRGDLALLIHDGEYSLRYSDGHWSITKYQEASPGGVSH